MELPSPVQIFLSENKLATIATIAQDSEYPHVIPVFYILEETTLYFPSAKESKKLRDIVSHPRMTISITNEQTLTSLELKGNASVVQSPEKKLELLKKISEISVAGSTNAFPPLLKLNTNPGVEIVSFFIEWYRFSSYAQSQPEVIEGKV